MTVETQHELMRYLCLALRRGSPPHIPCGACHLAGGKTEAQGEPTTRWVSDRTSTSCEWPVWRDLRGSYSHAWCPLVSSSSLIPSVWACVLGQLRRASCPTPDPSLGQDSLCWSLLIFFLTFEILLFDTNIEPRADNEPTQVTQSYPLRYLPKYSGPLSNVGVREHAEPLHGQKSACNYCLPQTGLLLTEKPYLWHGQSNSMYFVCYMYYILYLYNQYSKARKEKWY